MRILLTGGGTGGHFYPLMAVAEKINQIAKEEKVIKPELYYMGPYVIDQQELMEQDIIFLQAPAGKWRKYFSLQNFSDMFKTFVGIIKATWILYKIYPDVVFSKGGYAAFPATVAARILSIPLVIHESDARPGTANKIAAKWAYAIATSYPGTAEYFIKLGVKEEKIALTGHPVRDSLVKPIKEGAYKYLGLDPNIPTIAIFGGTQGAKAINDAVIEVLPELIKKYQIIHQTGPANEKDVRAVTNMILKTHPNKDRYHVYGFLNRLALRMTAGVTKLIISRAGTGTIFEIATWGIPSILIPIPEEISHDQSYNAFFYAGTGAAVVIKQKNLKKTILLNEIERILTNPDLYKQMSHAAKNFAKPNAATKIARLILQIGLEHES